MNNFDALGMKMEVMDKKLDLLVNIATRPLDYELDSRH